MNSTSIKGLLKQHNLKPLKRMGQNFLISPNVVNKVVSTAELKPNDIVLEVGPGIGSITLKTAERIRQVIAIEKDRGLANILKNVLEERSVKNVEVVISDILQYRYTGREYKVVSNLPYNIATAVIMRFLEAKNPPQTMVVMLQKEVGQRICAKPPKMSRLAVFTQFYSTAKIIGYVSKRNFYPEPKVDSAILKVASQKKYQKQADKTLFTKIVKAGFSHPRKQLINNLSKGLGLKRNTTLKWLSESKIKPNQRAETLTLNNWLSLTKSYP